MNMSSNSDWTVLFFSKIKKTEKRKVAKKDFQDFIEKKNITDGKNYNCSYVVQNMVVIQASSWMKNLRGAFFVSRK